MEKFKINSFAAFKWPIIIFLIWTFFLASVLSVIHITDAGHKKYIESGFFNTYNLTALLVFSISLILLLLFYSIKFFKNSNYNDLQEEQEIENQKKAVNQAIVKVANTLKISRAMFWRNISYNYKLPWFLVCGPSQSGKTTFLNGSGLRIPNQDMSEKNIDLTFNSRLLVSDAAILIDSAGPFSEQVDIGIWDYFINRLRRFRPTQPINGIILVIDLELIRHSTDVRLSAMGLKIRDNLSHLQNLLGVTPPVYLVFTKIDQLFGCTSFFKGSPPVPINQVFGLTFPLAKDDNTTNEHFILDQFSKEYDEFIIWQLPRMLERANQEQLPKSRYEAFIFLTELMGLKKNIASVLDKAFSPSALDDNIMLRGVYFVNGIPLTSATNNNAIEKNYKKNENGVEISPAAGYFIKDLFEKVIMNESGLVGYNENARKLIDRIRMTLITLFSFALISLITWQIVSFSNNNSLINSFNSGVEKANQQLDGLIKRISDQNTVSQIGWTIPFLEALQDLPSGWNDTMIAVPLTERAGLSQRNILSQAAINVYTTSLQRIFLPRIYLMIESNLVRPDIKPSDLYENLMVYLMFSGVHQIDFKIAHKVIERDFAEQYSGVDYDILRKNFSEHLHNILEISFSPLNKDVEIITLVRNKLKDFSPAKRGFNLLTELNQIRDLPYWRSQDAFGPLGSIAIKRRSGESLYVYIPGMYTSNAMTSVVLPAIPRVADTIAKEDWVLFNSTQKVINAETREKLRSDIIAIYVKNYVETWDHLLNDIDFKTFADFKQEVTLLQSLIGPPSPVENFLLAVAKETAFLKDQTINADKNNANSSEAILPSDTNLFDNQKAMSYINDHFADLHSFVTGTPNGVSELLKNLNQIKSIIGPIASSNNIMNPESGKLIANFPLGQSLEQLQSVVIKSPNSIEDAVSSLIRQTTILIESSAQNDIESGWKDNVLKYCQRSINNHFPFASTKEDATINDFIKIFSPDGILDQFYNKYISSYVDTSTSPWRLLVNTSSKIEINARALHMFEQAFWIKKVFFPGGAKEPRISFGIMPVDLDIRAKSVSLDIGGQSLFYQYGSQQTQTMLWPNGNNNVRINFASTDTDQSKSLLIEGPWALFRLIQMQKFEKLSPNRFTLDVSFSGRYVNFIIEAATVDNPFLKNLLRGFSCPTSLVAN